MEFVQLLPKRALTAAVIAGTAVGLSGCFDLAQKVAVHSDNSGSYAVEIAANGIVGEGLSDKHHHVDIDVGDDDDKGVTHVRHQGDMTVRTTEFAFKDLSGLRLGDETVGLHVKGKTDGLTEVNFHRNFQIGHARHRHDDDDDHVGRDVLQSMFGGHTYTFAVWLPGKIERIAPVRVGNRTVSPTVWGDAYGHTLIWKMPLTDMFLAENVDFDVDFAAKGDFHDSQSQPSLHRGHHHHDDDDDDDD
jgi:hypothetical protein